jgi:hypothetical protein
LKVLESNAEVKRYLEDNGWIADGEPIVVQAMTGGVSCNVWKITSGPNRWVLKQPLPKLKVEAEWYADVRRSAREQQAMQPAAT